MLSENSDLEISVYDLFLHIKQNLWGGLIAGVTGGILGVALSFFVTKEYTSKAILLPSESSFANSSSGSLGEISSLVSLSGLAGGADVDNVDVAIKLVSTRSFSRYFADKRNLREILALGRGWDTGSDKVIVTPPWYKRFNQPDEKKEITDGQVARALDGFFTINRNRKTGFIEAEMKFYDADFAAKLLEWVVEDLNEIIRQRDKESSKRNLAFLYDEVERVGIADQKVYFYKLIEAQLQNLMLAEVSPEYVFEVIDPPFIPMYRSYPSRSLFLVIGGTLFVIGYGFWIMIPFCLRRMGSID